MADVVTQLPRELWLHVLAHAGAVATARFAVTCLAAHRLQQDESLWREFVLASLRAQGVPPALLGALEPEMLAHVRADDGTGAARLPELSGARLMFQRTLFAVAPATLCLQPAAQPALRMLNMAHGPQFAGTSYWVSEADTEADAGRAMHLRSALWWLSVSARLYVRHAGTYTLAWRVRFDADAAGDPSLTVVVKHQTPEGVSSGNNTAMTELGKWRVASLRERYGEPWFYIVVEGVGLPGGVSVSCDLQDINSTIKGGLWIDRFVLLPSIVLDGALARCSAAVVHGSPARSMAVIRHDSSSA